MKPVLKGVNHQAKVFTPRSKLLKSSLTPESVQTLRRLCKAKKGEKPQVRETQLYFVAAGGDNLCENLFCHTKNTMRRTNTLGRLSASTASDWKAIQALASAALLRAPGFESVLKACALFRSSLAKGAVRVHPKDAFTSFPWLHET